MMTDMDEWAFLLNLFVINNPELLKCLRFAYDH